MQLFNLAYDNDKAMQRYNSVPKEPIQLIL